MKKKIHYGENTDVYPGIIARNKAVLEYEKFMHRTYYPHIIHPYSYLRVNWEKTAIIVIPVGLMIFSILWASFPHATMFYQVPVLLFQFYNLCDVGMNFVTGYIDPKTEIAILDPKKIIKRYLLTYFVLDIVSCIPYNLMHYVHPSWCMGTIKNNDLSDILSHLAYLRYFTFLRYFRNLAKILLWNIFLMGMICTLMFMYLLMILSNDFYTFMNIVTNNTEHIIYGVDNSSIAIFCEENSLIREHAAAYFHDLLDIVLDCFFYDDDDRTNYIYLRAVILVITFFCNIVLVAYFIKYFMLKITPTERFLDMESRIASFVRIRHLSRTFKNKVLLYFQILLENKSYREDEIFSYIPDTFKADIFFHLCLPLLKIYSAFDDLPKHVLRRLAECMKYQLYLPNEIVVSKNDSMLSMFFVHRGTVALYSANNVELYHFEGGSSFNGRNLILDHQMPGYYAIATEAAEVYRIDKEDFDNIMKNYPTLLEEIRQKTLLDNTEIYLQH